MCMFKDVVMTNEDGLVLFAISKGHITFNNSRAHITCDMYKTVVISKWPIQ